MVQQLPQISLLGMRNERGISVIQFILTPRARQHCPVPTPGYTWQPHGGAAAAVVSVPSILPRHLPKTIDPTNATAEHALQPSHSQPSMRAKAPSILVCFKIAQAFASPVPARLSDGVNSSAITLESDWDPETYNAIPNCLTDAWTHQTLLQPAASRHCTQYCQYR